MIPPLHITQHIRYGLTPLPFGRNVVYAGAVSRSLQD